MTEEVKKYKSILSFVINGTYIQFTCLDSMWVERRFKGFLWWIRAKYYLRIECTFFYDFYKHEIKCKNMEEASYYVYYIALANEKKFCNITLYETEEKKVVKRETKIESNGNVIKFPA